MHRDKNKSIISLYNYSNGKGDHKKVKTRLKYTGISQFTNRIVETVRLINVSTLLLRLSM